MSRVIYLDPHCIENVLRRKYEKQVNKYFSQMVVECQNVQDKEEVVDSEGETNLRFTIKDSCLRRPNPVIETWNENEVKPRNTIVKRKSD